VSAERPPSLHIEIPVQGEPRSWVDSLNAELSAGLRVDLEDRDLADEVADLLDRVVPEIRSQRGAA
jgi:hypothetical protein